MPLILQGPAHVQAWVDEQLPDLDEDFLARLAQVYQADPLFAAALGDARGAPEPDMGMGAAGAQGIGGPFRWRRGPRGICWRAPTGRASR